MVDPVLKADRDGEIDFRRMVAVTTGSFRDWADERTDFPSAV